MVCRLHPLVGQQISRLRKQIFQFCPNQSSVSNQITQLNQSRQTTGCMQVESATRTSFESVEDVADAPGAPMLENLGTNELYDLFIPGDPSFLGGTLDGANGGAESYALPTSLAVHSSAQQRSTSYSLF